MPRLLSKSLADPGRKPQGDRPSFGPAPAFCSRRSGTYALPHLAKASIPLSRPSQQETAVPRMPAIPSRPLAFNFAGEYRPTHKDSDLVEVAYSQIIVLLLASFPHSVSHPSAPNRSTISFTVSSESSSPPPAHNALAQSTLAGRARP